MKQKKRKREERTAERRRGEGRRGRGGEASQATPKCTLDSKKQHLSADSPASVLSPTSCDAISAIKKPSSSPTTNRLVPVCLCVNQ